MKPLASLDALADHVPDGSAVIAHSGCGEPLRLTAALARQSDRLRDVSLTMMMPMGDAPFARPELRGHLDVFTFFPGRALRKAVNDGSATLRREPLSRLPSLFMEGRLAADVLLLQLSLPDADGRMSLGLSVDYMPAVLSRRPLVIAAVNPAYPRTLGDGFVTEEQVDFFVEDRAPVQTIVPGTGDDKSDRSIADRIADLIGDGDVLQVGIGTLPDLVLARLSHRRDLGIHTGIITDAVMTLIDAGVVTNDRKAAFRGVSVATMAGGTERFYAFLDCNPAISFQPCSITHDVRFLASIERLTAINSVLEVDLKGFANAEHVDGRRVSAPGGLPDFATGAAAAPGGRSIVALRSTSKDGRTSRIRRRLDEDQPATLVASQIDYLVTEHGVARLTGLDGSCLANAIAAVAHPDFREALRSPPPGTATP